MTKEKFKLDFIGIGAPKAATTWIAQCMKEHPKICFPKDWKELHFFSERHIAYGTKVKNRNYEIKGFKWLISQFKHCKKGNLIGEFSVSYLSCPTAAKRIKKHFPDTKIIACLRNPIDRVYVAYLYGVRFGDYSKSFEETIKKDTYLLEKGLYAKYLPNYLKNFKNVHIIFVDDMVKNPEKVIKNLYKFLGIDENFVPPSLHSKVNIDGMPKVPIINKIIAKTNYITRKYNLDFIAKLALITGADRLMERIRMVNVKEQEFEKMKPETRQFLKKFYEKDIKKLEKMTKRNLNHWLK